MLNALSQRHASGIISGELLVDGKPLDAGFQKSTGLCLQADVYLPSSTVREVRRSNFFFFTCCNISIMVILIAMQAVTFSALLRQPREVSREEKLAEVCVCG